MSSSAPSTRMTLPSLRQYGFKMSKAIQHSRALDPSSSNQSPLSMALILATMKESKTTNFPPVDMTTQVLTPTRPYTSPTMQITAQKQHWQHWQMSNPPTRDRSESQHGNHRPTGEPMHPHHMMIHARRAEPQQQRVVGMHDTSIPGPRKSRKLCTTMYCDKTAVSGGLCRRHGGKESKHAFGRVYKTYIFM